MPLLLWDHPLSPYVQKVKIALREKGLSFDAVLPGGIGAGGAGGDFVAANPRQEVPALIHDDTAVFDSTVILKYLEDAFPTPPLLPAGAADRARVRMLEDVVDTQMEAVNWGLSELKWFGRGKGAVGERLEARAREQIAGLYAWLERQLGARRWFNGDAFGWGDLSVLPYVAGSVGHGVAIPDAGPLADWFARAAARPSAADTFAEARAAAQSGGGMGQVADLVEKGLFKRQYRDHRLEWMIRSGGLDVVTDGLAKGNIRFSPELA